MMQIISQTIVEVLTRNLLLVSFGLISLLVSSIPSVHVRAGHTYFNKEQLHVRWSMQAVMDPTVGGR
jgi:hypothetical protein